MAAGTIARCYSEESVGTSSSVAEMDKLSVGELFAGKYEILSLVGSGGMGTVYKAYQADLDRIVAVKVLSSVLRADDEQAKRFEREARIVSQLTHEHVCKFFSYAQLPTGQILYCHGVS